MYQYRRMPPPCEDTLGIEDAHLFGSHLAGTFDARWHLGLAARAIDTEVPGEAALLFQLQSAGLTLSRLGNQLVVAPRERLTDEFCNLIRTSKAALWATHIDDFEVAL
jgi:hypothetical protein